MRSGAARSGVLPNWNLARDNAALENRNQQRPDNLAQACRDPIQVPL
jgi:hypothetical protein